MPMPPYQLYCYTKGCKHPAVYKIAARWSDGIVRELKTYGLCCEECLPAWFERGRQRQQPEHGPGTQGQRQRAGREQPGRHRGRHPLGHGPGGDGGQQADRQDQAAREHHPVHGQPP